MADQSKMKLGNTPRKFDARTLRLARYLTPGLPPPPPAITNSEGIARWGMMLNDTLGDCTIAGVAHAIEVVTLSQGAEVTVPDATVLQIYEQWDGYNPSHPASDYGDVELDVLNDWPQQGFAGYKLQAFADPDAQDTGHVRQAISLFGGLYIGLELPDQRPGSYPGWRAGASGMKSGVRREVLGVRRGGFTPPKA